MKDLLNRLIQSIPGGNSGRVREAARDEPVPPSQKSIQLQEVGRLPRDPKAARRVVEARREQFGEHHPDYAESLSHLGSLLFERGDHDSAEPLLRQAVTIRKAALGGNHPEVRADLQTLEAILEARSRPTIRVPDNSGGASNHIPIPASASDTALEQLARGPREIAVEARGLAETFAQIGASMAMAGQRMREGLPPPFPLLNDAAACHNAFVMLHDEAVRRAGAADLAPAEGTVLSLLDLAGLMDRLVQLEEERARITADRLHSLSLLDRVLSLRHRIAAESSLLGPCHDAARELRSRLADISNRASLPDDALRLASGQHPLAALLRLLEPDRSLSDDEWSRLRVEVVNAFGRPLAAAAVRGRLAPATDDRAG